MTSKEMPTRATQVIQHKRLRPFKAISFDLDDTLYDNHPIIKNAVEQSFSLLNQHFPKTKNWTMADWQQAKKVVLAQTPALQHDTGEARYALLHYGLMQHGYSEKEATQGAQQTMDCFRHHRSDFSLSQETLALLNQLKQHYPLVGITNGNVDASRIGLDNVFDFVLHPGHGLKMKPYADMFHLACERLGIQHHELLHIGDHPVSDVMGAKMIGAQAVWLNPCQQGAFKQSETLLPTLTITSLTALRVLI